MTRMRGGQANITFMEIDERTHSMKSDVAQVLSQRIR